jgi:hypothetical protein
VLGAHPAVLFEALLQLLPCSMHPHVEIVFADAEGCSNGLCGFLIQIEPPN